MPTPDCFVHHQHLNTDMALQVMCHGPLCPFSFFFSNGYCPCHKHQGRACPENGCHCCLPSSLSSISYGVDWNREQDFIFVWCLHVCSTWPKIICEGYVMPLVVMPMVVFHGRLQFRH